MIAAMIFSWPPQFGQCSMSISKAKLQRKLTCTQVMSQLKSASAAEPGHKQSTGLFVPGEGPGHRPGAACKAGPAQPNWAVVRTGRLAISGRCGLRGWFGFLRHHLRAQLGIGRENAVVRSLREAKLRRHQTNEVQSGARHQGRQPLHELQR